MVVLKDELSFFSMLQFTTPKMVTLPPRLEEPGADTKPPRVPTPTSPRRPRPVLVAARSRTSRRPARATGPPRPASVTAP